MYNISKLNEIEAVKYVLDRLPVQLLLRKFQAGR